MFSALILGYLLKTSNRKFVATIILTVTLISIQPWTQFESWPSGTLRPGSNNLSTQLSIVETIYKDSNNQQFSVYVSTPPVYDYTFRYLFNWVSKLKKAKLPQKNKQKIVYIIREQEKADGSGDYFRKNVIRTEQVPTKTWKIEKDIVVEKIITKDNEQPIDYSFLPNI